MSSSNEPLDIQALLHETRWMRFLAARLVRDEHEAEDMVQDIWVAALEKPPSHKWDVRRWLRGVGRNVARQRARGAMRRAERERAAARAEATAPSTASLVERACIHRGVVDAVLGLAEPYRTTVLLRFFEEIPASGIAARQGVALETVRTRIKRALATLRERLDTRFGGRASWCGPLIAGWLTGSEIPAAGLTAGASSTAPAASTATWIGLTGKIAAAVLVAAGLAFVVRELIIPLEALPEEAPLPRSTAETTAPPRDEPAGPTIADDRAPSAAPVGPADDPAARPPRTAALGPAIRGVVRDPRGSPVPGARVAAFDLAGPGTIGDSVSDLAVSTETRTDAQGAYALGPVEPWVMVEAEADGHARERRLAAAGSRQDFVLQMPGRLVGRIETPREDPAAVTDVSVVLIGDRSVVNLFGFDARGEPGIRSIQMAHARSRTDASGRFAFDTLAPGAYRVWIFPHDRASVKRDRVPVVIRSGQTTTCDVALPHDPGFVAAGRLVDAGTGCAIRAARVRVEDNFRQTATTNDRGAFRLSGVEAGPIRLRIAAAGYLTTLVEAVTTEDGADNEAEYALSRPARIRGRVVDPAGHGVAGVRVTTSTDGLVSHDPSTTAVTDGDGRFALDRVTPDPAGRVFAAADGYATAMSRTLILGPGETVTDVSIPLGAGGRVAGMVSETSGIAVCLQPVADDDEAPVAHPPVPPVRIDAAGRFLFPHVPPGSYRITAWIGRQFHTFTPRMSVIEGGFEVVDLTAQPTGRIAGRVCDEAGRAVKWTEIEAVPEEPGIATDLTYSGENGAFCFEALRPGRYALRVHGQGRFSDAEVSAVRTDRDDVEMRLVTWRPLHGRVVRADTGQSIPRFWVRLHGIDPSGHVRTGERRFSDPDGTFTFPSRPDVTRPGSLRRGRYDLQAGTDDGWISPVIRDVDVPASAGAATLVFRLDRAGGIEGVVRSPDGALPPRAEVVARAWPADRAGPPIRARTDDRGRFALRTLRPGTYRVAAIAGEQVTDAEVVRVQCDAITRLDLVARPGGAVRITVEAPDGRPVAGAVVRLQPLRTEERLFAPPAPITAGEDGRCRFDGLRPGRYAIEAAHPAWVRVTAEIELERGAASAVTLGLGRGGEIRVTVTRAGQPVAGAAIEIRTSDGRVCPPDLSRYRRRFGSARRAWRPGQWERLVQTLKETDAAGTLRRRFLPAGAYRVIATVPGVPPATARIEVRDGDTASVALVLQE